MNKKTIWITGGSTGIGKALAIKFAKEGWNVAISARRENLLKETCGEHENISSFPLDVTDKNKCKEVFQNIVNTFHNVDICFFSTGTWDPKREKDIEKQKDDLILDVYPYWDKNPLDQYSKPTYHFRMFMTSIDASKEFLRKMADQQATDTNERVGERELESLSFAENSFVFDENNDKQSN